MHIIPSILGWLVLHRKCMIVRYHWLNIPWVSYRNVCPLEARYSSHAFFDLPNLVLQSASCCFHHTTYHASPLWCQTDLFPSDSSSRSSSTGNIEQFINQRHCFDRVSSVRHTLNDWEGHMGCIASVFPSLIVNTLFFPVMSLCKWSTISHILVTALPT